MLVDPEQRLWRRTASAVLGIGLVLVLVSLWQLLGDVHLPGNHVGYSPEQPIAYSHRLHAGELEIPCLYCHFGAEKSRHAGVPSADVSIELVPVGTDDRFQAVVDGMWIGAQVGPIGHSTKSLNFLPFSESERSRSAPSQVEIHEV